VDTCSVTGRVWRRGQLEEGAVSLEELSELVGDHDVAVWFDLCGPAREQLQTLADELGLDPHAVEDAVARSERPKTTRHASHTFVTAYATSLAEHPGADPYASRLVLSKVSAFVLPRVLITVGPDDSFPMGEVLARWDENAGLLGDGDHAVDVLLHGLLDVIVDGYFDTVETLDDAIEDVEGLLFDEQVSTGEVQRGIYRIRKELVQLRRVVLPMREVVNTLWRHREDRGIDRSDPLQGHFDDLYDHVIRAAEWTESLRDLVGTIFETNLSLQDAQLNTVMKKLAGWAAIIAVPTAVTGWFGQNVPYPGFGSVAGLWQSAVLVVVASLALYLAFRRKDWL
jgi:magnesium transporter